MQQDFGIRARQKDVPLVLQCLPQFPEIINFPVIYNHQGLIFIEDGLLALFQIDNRQTFMGQTHRTFKKKPLGIGTAVMYEARHPGQQVLIHLPLIVICQADYAAQKMNTPCFMRI
jgi:hypothetical protein